MSICTRIKPCHICPFKNSDFDRTETLQDEYHRMAMLEMAQEGDEVWTCLHHLNYEKSDIKIQCHVGAKELIRAKEALKSQLELQ